jgi:hypothetical protein
VELNNQNTARKLDAGLYTVMAEYEMRDECKDFEKEMNELLNKIEESNETNSEADVGEDH